LTTDKTDEPDQRSAAENASGSIQQGFADPAGEYPRRKYMFEPSTNKAARARQRNELSIGGGLDGMSVELPPMQESRYPHNQVMETTSGHVIEFDDTPGGERVLIRHNSGSGVELRSDGSTVMKTEANSVTSVAGSSALIVEGEATMKFNGNLSLSVAGDLNLDVGGNINTTVGGDAKDTINGAKRETVYGAKGSVVRGNRSETTVGTTTKTHLSNLNEVVKGDNRRSIQGDAFWGVSGTMKQSAATAMIISSDDVNIAAQSLSVFGASGTIGGADCVHYGRTYYGTSFYGDLIGTAEKAVLADVTNSQNYSDPDTDPGSGGNTGSAAGFTATDDGAATASASAGTMDSYLNKSANGSAKVLVDEGDYLKNTVDRTKENDGISDRPLNTREIRSTLRDPATMANPTFVGNASSSGRLSPTYANTVPAGIGRISNSRGSVRLPQESNNTSHALIDRFRPDKNVAVSTFTPNPMFDPNKITTTIPINGAVELARGIRMARFLGGTGDRVTLSHISTREEKLQLARQFSLQANAVNTVLNNRGEFKNHRLVVVEGLYKVGPSETLTADSVNDRATRGEVVVYEVHNQAGRIDLGKTYDLAAWWKDTLGYDKLSLSYDSFDPSGELTAQIVLIMPPVDADYNLVNGRYANKLETTYNNNVQGNELIEVTAA
jgi:hypothetical protein